MISECLVSISMYTEMTVKHSAVSYVQLQLVTCSVVGVENYTILHMFRRPIVHT